MQYIERKVIGDAGEYYFAYWVTKHFRWPCRRLDIDLGIDAQLEILNNENNTTGDFIAIQVKATEQSKSTASVRITKDNLEYWKTIEIPVVIVYVDLNTNKLYWECINRIEIDTYIKQASKTTNLDTQIKFTKELTKDSKADFIKLLFPEEEFDEVLEVLSDMETKCVELQALIWDEKEDDLKPSINLEHFEGALSILESIYNKYDRLEEILNRYPNLRGHLDTYMESDPSNFSSIMIKINSAHEQVRTFFKWLFGMPEQMEYLEDEFKRSRRHYKIEKMYDNWKYYRE